MSDKLPRLVPWALCLLLIWSVPASASDPYTNEDVHRLLRAGLSVPTVCDLIRNSQPGFDLSADAILNLKEKGVPEEIIRAMIERQTEQRGANDPSRKPLTFDRVLLSRPNAPLFTPGCLGSLIVDDAGIHWSDTNNCWNRQDVDFPLAELTAVDYVHYPLIGRTTMIPRFGGNHEELALSIARAGPQKVFFYLKGIAPHVGGRCFVSVANDSSSTSGTEYQAIDCEAWASR